MRHLIKQAIVYKAHIPTDQAELHNHLAEKSFVELGAMDMRGAGFVPIGDSCSLVTPFHGGLAFRLRHDEKIIPASAIAKEVDRLAKIVLESTGKKPGAKRRRELKEEAISLLVQKAFTRTAAVTCFYDIGNQYLIVATTSKKLSDTVMTQLVHACASIKTETLHVSSVKLGLTTKLKQWLADPDCGTFGPFHPCGEAALVDNAKRKVSVKMTSLDAAQAGLNEALLYGAGVTSLGFSHGGRTEFRLTQDFQFKGIEYVHDAPNDEADPFPVNATLEVAAVSGIVTDLLELLGAKEEAGEVNPEDSEDDAS